MSVNLWKRLGACCLVMMVMLSHAHAAGLWKEDIAHLVGEQYIVGEVLADMPAYPLFVANPTQSDAKPELKAYAFESNDFSTARGFSGKTINIFIVMDLSGNLLFLKLLDHKEPLFIRTDDTARLASFAIQHKGLSLQHTIQIGKSSDTPSRNEQSAFLQGVHTGTTSAKAISRTIMTAAATVAIAKLKLNHPFNIETKSPDKEVKAEPPWELPGANASSATGTTKLSPTSKTMDKGKDTGLAPSPAIDAEATSKTSVPTPAGTAQAEPEVASAAADNTQLAEPVQANAMSAQALVNLQADDADWKNEWKARRYEIATLLAGLTLLSVALFMQKRFSAQVKRLRILRTLYLLFTLGFLGWYAQGQLTIVNITAAIESLVSGDDLSYLMNDPMTVILWIFVGATLLVWGRGTFCGWLCPFGALQELISLLSNAVGIRQRRVRAALDAKLKWIKYAVLVVIIASLSVAPAFSSWAVEIEPFKTAISLYFQRSWPFVLWAVACLTLTVFVYRGYCRYICPLGAALASMNFLRRWSWIARRTECGTPCQSCRHRCEYQAIEPSGKINYSECFQCLDCVSIYQDDQRCLPLIQHKKQSRAVIAIQPVEVVA